MNPQIPPYSELFAPYIQGDGIQYFPGETVPFPALPGLDDETLSATADGALDFVIAGPGWLEGPIPVTLLGEWRRVLVEGGTLAVLIRGEEGPVDLVARFVGREAGLAMDNPRAVGDGTWLVTGRRSFRHTLLQVTESMGRELGHGTKPQGWEGELYFSLGSLLLNVGDGLNAATLFENALAEEPGNVEVRIGLALALGVQGNARGAEALLAEVLRDEPDHPIALEWRERFRRILLQPRTAPAAQASTAAPAPTTR